VRPNLKRERNNECDEIFEKNCHQSPIYVIMVGHLLQSILASIDHKDLEKTVSFFENQKLLVV
jgi:hypothetical protein